MFTPEEMNGDTQVTNVTAEAAVVPSVGTCLKY